MKNYAPERDEGWMQRLGLGRGREPPPQGLYVYGDVGRGKSMLMNMFFAAAPVQAKSRVHFHAFMLEIHAAIHAWRQSDPATRGGDDPIKAVAKRIAHEVVLLCFDEFQVEDVADAMILRRLFAKLFERGVVVVATANIAPDDLYAGGLNRQLFLPFVALLQERLDVLHLAGGVDHRLERLAGQKVWHSPLGGKAAGALDQAFATLTGGARPAPLDLTIQDRVLRVPAQASGVARFTFAELCEPALGAADYLEIARLFHTLILAEIPRLAPERRDQAKRLVTLIDALYEAKTKLIASAAAAPERLYPQGDGAAQFKRAASRLVEMQSAEYMAAPHGGG